jgi:hypothetical protein
MNRLRFQALTAALAALGATAACSSNAPMTPTNPTPVMFTEVFSGSLNPTGASSHVFIAQASGIVTATLTTLSPDPAVPLGIALGTWTGSACQIIIANDRAVQGSTINGSVGAAGSLCIRAADTASNITPGNPVSYEITVVHP